MGLSVAFLTNSRQVLNRVIMYQISRGALDMEGEVAQTQFLRYLMRMSKTVASATRTLVHPHLDIWQHLETFLVVMTGGEGVIKHLVGRGQRCY